VEKLRGLGFAYFKFKEKSALETITIKYTKHQLGKWKLDENMNTVNRVIENVDTVYIAKDSMSKQEHKLGLMNSTESSLSPIHSQYSYHLPFTHALSTLNHGTFISQVGEYVKNLRGSKHMSKVPRLLGKVEKTSQK
ncbi:hypothetical protein STEG23_022535, partial [Scotinomys teguina]